MKKLRVRIKIFWSALSLGGKVAFFSLLSFLVLFTVRLGVEGLMFGLAIIAICFATSASNWGEWYKRNWWWYNR